LSTIIDSLLDDPKKKFSEVEMKFFSMWWDVQTDRKKEQVKELVANG
jgi:lysosomal alpha-mannosidase